MPEAFIVKATRTAGGRKGGRLSGWRPADLAAQVLNDLVGEADPALFEDVIMGCVGQAGEQAFNVARGAILCSKLPESIPGVSVDRQCGSSQQAIHFAAQAVMSGTQDIVIAAGVESMSRVPMGTPVVAALKLGLGGPGGVGQEARYPGVKFSQFAGAEMIAKKYDLSKDILDEFGYQSQRRAIAATESGAFDDEILPIEVVLPDGTSDIHRIDEGIRFDVTLEGVKNVKLLAEDGRVTAATSSQICDGASGVVIANERGLKALGAEPLAAIRHLTVIGHDPVIMLEAPIPATQRALARAGMKIDDIDLYEVNEAFAPVPVAWTRALGADPEKLNVHGGAIALGHPLGASGTKLMATLVHALRRRNKKYGLQTMCEGGGLANVTIVERL